MINEISESSFPILGCVKNNVITDEFLKFVFRQVPEENEQKDIINSANLFFDRTLKINYISENLHEALLNTSNFLEAKSQLKNSPETVGLLLLPEILYPDFTNVPSYVEVDNEEYPIDAILYSWLNINDHDRLTGDLDPEDPWEKEEDRQLFILPIFYDGTTQATKNYEMMNNDELYGWDYSDTNGRAWYGKIHDYVMSFILYYNSLETLNPDDILKKSSSSLNIQTLLSENGSLIEITDKDVKFF